MLTGKKLLMIFLLPLLLTGCARAQGALAPTGVSPSSEGFTPIRPDDISYLPDVEPASLEPIINYVDGLNLALTGEFLYLKSTALSSCDCLEIANQLAKLVKTTSLVGAGYQLTGVQVIKDGVNQKSFQVIINRSQIRKIDKSSGQSRLWSAATLKNTFTVNRIGKVWLLRDIK